MAITKSASGGRFSLEVDGNATAAFVKHDAPDALGPTDRQKKHVASIADRLEGKDERRRDATGAAPRVGPPPPPPMPSPPADAPSDHVEHALIDATKTGITAK